MIKKVIHALTTLAIGGRLIRAADVSLSVNPTTQLVEVDTDYSPTVSVIWDRIVQSYVVDKNIGPTLAAAAYGTMHTAIYDAWAEFEDGARQFHGRNPIPMSDKDKTPENQLMAMTRAAQLVLGRLFPDKGEELRMEVQRQGMGIIRGLPRAVARRAARAVLNMYAKKKKADFNYAPLNSKVDSWRPERVPIDDPNGPLQQFLTPEFGNLKITFGIEDGASFRPPSPKPFLLVNATVDVDKKTIRFNEGVTQQVSTDMIGDIINPEFIEQCKEVIDYSRSLDDRGKVIAEFWEDGGGTSFPPGTWMTFGQYISARDDHSVGKDVKMFLALGNAVRDAAIASWNAKMFYYYARPVRAIRDLGKLGLIGIADENGDYEIEAYDVLGKTAGKILAREWLTYQTPGGHPSPPFPEYTSGHSTFSSAAAEVLKRFTGNDNFGASITILKGHSRFEPSTTPTQDVTLEWASFSEAADEAGLSRLHGGIHFMDGNTYGKEVGKNVGEQAFAAARALFGTI